jgi:hypothetical protein
MVVWLFPYVPLRDRLTIGTWTLIPREAFADEDAIAPEAAEQARGLAALYRMPGDPRGYGAFVRSELNPVGEEVDQVALGRLYQTVVVTLLDGNASRANPQDDDYNAAHRMGTLENARLLGHGIDPDGYTSFQYGVMVQMLVGGYQVGRDVDKIEPPQELQLPLMPPRIDDVYANALNDVLSNLSENSPDLPGAIRWLEVAWSNSVSVRLDTRILALRAGFDVLFGGADTRAIRTGLSALLDAPDAVRRSREWDDHGRHRGPFELTDLEWWFQSFALLRNKVAHGGIDHLWHAELNLRRAIKKTVANAGHEDVLLDPFERIVHKHAARIIQDAVGEED